MDVTTRRITVDEYYKMAEVGILKPDERVELLDGEIIQMSPIGIRHRNCVNNLTRILNSFLPDEFIVSPQNPVRIDEDDEPVPDITVVKVNALYKEFVPEDVVLLIEVADTTYAYDRTVKLQKYAAAGISEVWIVNLNRNVIETFHNYQQGAYTEINVFDTNDKVRPRQLSSVIIEVAKVLNV